MHKSIYIKATLLITIALIQEYILFYAELKSLLGFFSILVLCIAGLILAFDLGASMSEEGKNK